MAQVVECLPSKYEAVSSNPSVAKKKKRKKENLIQSYEAICTVLVFAVTWENRVSFHP
jgi:hypothetical protein